MTGNYVNTSSYFSLDNNHAEIPLSIGKSFLMWSPCAVSSGNFYIDRSSTRYYFSNYGGYFSFSESWIRSGAFANSEITEMIVRIDSGIEGGTFGALGALTSVTLLGNVYLGSIVFGDCYNLQYVSAIWCRGISGVQTFGECSSLKSIYLPMCSQTHSATATFYKCVALSSAYLPFAQSIGHWTFKDCTNLTEVTLSFCYYVDSSAFDGCSKLSYLELPLCRHIGRSAFLGCSSSFTLILNGSYFCQFDNLIYDYTPSRHIKIYVQSSLYSYYLNNYGSYAYYFGSINN